MYKKVFRVFLNLPFIFHILLLLLVTFYMGSAISYPRFIIEAILLLVIGIFLSLENKVWNILGISLASLNLLYNILLGYFDASKNVKFDNFGASIFIYSSLTLYYLLIFFLKKLPDIKFKKLANA